MIKTETTIRVRYGETDQMGYVYYGAYAQYFEVARVEAMRSLGITYREMEEKGVLMPVIHFEINYKKAALYDDEVRIVTTIKELPYTRITFHSESFNQKNELLNTGSVTLVFLDRNKKKPMMSPDWFLKPFEDLFEE